MLYVFYLFLEKICFYVQEGLCYNHVTFFVTLSLSLLILSLLYIDSIFTLYLRYVYHCLFALLSALDFIFSHVSSLYHMHMTFTCYPISHVYDYHMPIVFLVV